LEEAKKIILVTGATGNQGGATVRHFLKSDWKIKALTRNPDSEKSKKLEELGVEVLPGNQDDRNSLMRTMEGIYGVFSVQQSMEHGAVKEIEQGKRMGDVAKECGVQHFIYSSVEGAERNTGIPHFESKGQVEIHLNVLDLPLTTLRPVSFMENYYIPQIKGPILKGKMRDAIKGDKPFQLVATDNIGAFAALAFNNRDKFLGKTIPIAGDELTNVEIAATFEKVMGRKVAFKKLPLFLLRLAMGKDIFLMYKWYNEHGFEADIDGLRRDYPEIHLITLEQWLWDEGWDKID